jgi:hypothetical protein
VKIWVLGFEEEKMKCEDVSFFEFKMNIKCKKCSMIIGAPSFAVHIISI